MRTATCESDTAAWRELLPWATPEERRTLLDTEHLAARYFGELARGLSQVEAFEDPAALKRSPWYSPRIMATRCD
jgi:hypothetical protein